MTKRNIVTLITTIVVLSTFAWSQATSFPRASQILVTGATAQKTFQSPLVMLGIPANSGTVFVVYSSITGAPASCTGTVTFGGTTVTPTYTVTYASTVTPSTGNSTVYQIPIAYATPGEQFSAIAYGWACGTYPTGGTISIEFVPYYFSNWLTSSNISTATTTIVAMSILHSININEGGTVGTAVLRESNGSTCNVAAIFATITTSAATTPTTLNYDRFINPINGYLCIVTTGTVDLTVLSR